MLLRRHYDVRRNIEEETKADHDAEATRKDLEALKVPELKELAAASGIEGYKNLLKDELINAIVGL